MLGLYHAWRTGTLDHEEVYLDIAEGRMVPVRRAVPRQTASRLTSTPDCHRIGAPQQLT